MSRVESNIQRSAAPLLMYRFRQYIIIKEFAEDAVIIKMWLLFRHLAQTKAITFV